MNMFKNLINEYNKQLSYKNNKDIIDFNFEIIMDKNNIINNILEQIIDNESTPINITKINNHINNDKIINLIEIYLNENNIEFFYKNDTEIEDTETNNFLNMIIKNSKPTLTKKEEDELFEKYKNGDKLAKKEIIEHNYRLVLKIASKYTSTFLSKNDLFDAGIIGLYTAMKKYDYTKGYKFSTYATIWIKREILEEIYNKENIIRIPKSTNNKIKKYKNIVDELTKKLNRIPTDEEIIQNSNLTITQIDCIKSGLYTIISTDIPTTDESNTPLMESLTDSKEKRIEEIIEQKMDLENILNIINTITINEKAIDIMEMRYGFGKYNQPHTFEQIAKKINLTKQRVEQILYNSELKIKKEILKQQRRKNIQYTKK